MLFKHEHCNYLSTRSQHVCGIVAAQLKHYYTPDALLLYDVITNL